MSGKHRRIPRYQREADSSKDRYASFVEHPRFGKYPRVTGLNPANNHPHVFLHWHSAESCRIPNTAIAADLSRQAPATIAVTHYFDVERTCKDCGRQFIFFAEEQKYWYEELGFGLDSDCVRCVRCRKRQQGIALTRERYEELFHILDRSSEQSFEMAECCLRLVEEGVFHKRQIQRVRMLLRQIADECQECGEFADLPARLDAADESADHSHHRGGNRSSG